MKVNISEIFDSVQGEGRFTGHPAVFIRLAGCSVNCSFCDTKHAQKLEPEHQLQKDNLHTYNVERNPENWTTVSVQEVYEYVADLIEQSASDKANRIQMVVITGGEPFEQPEALGELCFKLPYLSSESTGVTDYLQVCIETSGSVPVNTSFTNEAGNTIGLVENVLMHIYQSDYCFLTVSPKPKGAHLEYLYAASQIKFLVGDKEENDVQIPMEVFKHVEGRSEGIAFQPIWYDSSMERTNKAIWRAIKKARIYGGVLSTQVHKFLNIR